MLKEGQIRIPSGCAISGIFAKDGTRIDGSQIVKSIATMHDRSNGLGGGFAGYGIYPDFKEYYALQLFFDDDEARHECERFIERHFEVVNSSVIKTRKHPKIVDAPLIWRYFAVPRTEKIASSQLDEKEFVSRCVNKINAEYRGAYVFSSGKNMGVFKAVGYPEDVGEFYMLEDYAAYCWTAHGRYPTNTPGWWGGAHPFSLLDYTIVHNGEISSYDANRRCIEQYGYKCSLQTDTEVITYIMDFLNRKKGLSLEEIAQVVAAPFWQDIESSPEREKLKYLREAFPSLLITGPFSIMLGFTGGLMALNDRLKLRSLVCAEKGDMVYLASEECAICAIEQSPDNVWSPKGGEPVIVRLNDGVEI